MSADSTRAQTDHPMQTPGERRHPPLHYNLREPTSDSHPMTEAVEIRPKAMFVVHGMGEQKRFDTIDTIVEGLKEHCTGFAAVPTSARTVQLGTLEPVQRTEIEYTREGKVGTLHVYEAYWAPLTEGQVTSADVMVFLFSAAWNGIRKWPNQFWRWLFQAPRGFDIPVATVFELLVAALALGALAVINLVVAGVVVTHTWTATNNPLLLDDLETVVVLVLPNLLLCGLLLLGISRKQTPRGEEPAIWLSTLGFAAFFAALSATISGAWWFLALIIHHTVQIQVPDGEWAVRVVVVMIASGLALILTGIYLRLLWPQRSARSTLAIGFGAFLMAAGCISLTAQILKWCVRTSDTKDGRGDLWHNLFLCGGTMREWLVRHGIVFSLIPLALFVCGLFFLRKAAHIMKSQPGRPAPWWTLPGGIFAVMVPTPLLTFWIICGSYGVIANIVKFDTAERVHPLVTFTLLFAASWKIKGFLIQYVGDVAAYVSSFRLDRFFKLRKEIQDVAVQVGRTIYGLPAQTGQLYESVLVVGHSLGSVIAYDTLNRLLVEEELGSSSAIGVRERTKLFLTFGSPLNKIAYLFTVLSDTKDQVREQLASSLQPLIDNALARKDLTWINVWSPNDIISGHIDYFDGTSSPNPVKNLIDDRARTPLLAHTEYWNNPMIYKEIFARL